MIPLRDSTRSHSLPVVNVTLIAVNLVIWLYMLTLPPRQALGLLLQYGFVPANLAGVNWAAPAEVLPLATAMFLHGGWMHVLGNMVYLWVFGDNVEDRLGHGRYLAFYLLCGIAASLGHALANPLSDRPVVGASGAVAGVLGAYLISFPRSRILALVPLGFFLHLAEVPAVFFLLVWLVLQFVNGIGSLVGVGEVGLVAWWAHVGGFLAGVILMLAMRRRSSWERG